MTIVNVQRPKMNMQADLSPKKSGKVLNVRATLEAADVIVRSAETMIPVQTRKVSNFFIRDFLINHLV